MKVVHVITELNIGGAEHDLYKLILHGDRTAIDYVVISLQDKGPFGEQIEALGVPVYTLGIGPSLPNPLAFLKLIRILRQEKPDIIQTWLHHADVLTTLASYFVPYKMLCWTITIVDISAEHFSRSLQIAINTSAKLSSRPDYIIANTKNGQRAHVERGYKDGKWRIIYNGFNTDIFKPDETARRRIRQELGIASDTFVIGKVGRLALQKNYPGFISAALNLLETRPDVHFIGVGKDVSLDTLGGPIPADLRDNFHLLGIRDDTAMIYNAFDIFTMTSDFEGLPNVVGEAMATGLPCVVTNAGDTAHIVDDTGIVVPVGDMDAIASAWIQLMNMPAEERSRLGQAARTRVETYFNLDQFVGQYQELYQSAIRQE